MRLIHTTTFNFQEFFDRGIPPYAIVSHRWGAEEVSHQDFFREDRRVGYGWIKVVKACEIARERDSLDWVWIDTCCIDKTSSAELTEAINSMFHWYRISRICYVFLPDVHDLSTYRVQLSDVYPTSSVRHQSYDGQAIDRETQSFSMKEFKESSWFTRAWTLQELLAPQQVDFFNAGFELFGTVQSLSDPISQTTGVAKVLLNGGFDPGNTTITILDRMRWAANRESTRREDRAYSMMGILNVNLPLLYGEGYRAFARLQKEVIATWDDDSIFCHKDSFHETIVGVPILAIDISGYATDVQLERSPTVGRGVDLHWHSFEWTNKGLKLTVWLSMRKLVLLSKKSDSRVKLKSCFYVILPLRCYFQCETSSRAGEECMFGLLIEVFALPATRPVHLARVFSGIRHRGLYYSRCEGTVSGRTKDLPWYRWGTDKIADYDIDLGHYDGSEVEAAVYVRP